MRVQCPMSHHIISLTLSLWISVVYGVIIKKILTLLPLFCLFIPKYLFISCVWFLRISTFFAQFPAFCLHSTKRNTPTKMTVRWQINIGLFCTTRNTNRTKEQARKKKNNKWKHLCVMFLKLHFYVCILHFTVLHTLFWTPENTNFQLMSHILWYFWRLVWFDTSQPRSHL